MFCIFRAEFKVEKKYQLLERETREDYAKDAKDAKSQKIRKENRGLCWLFEPQNLVFLFRDFRVTFASFAFKKLLNIYLNEALGCVSSTLTVNLPAKIASCFAFTLALTSAGTLLSNVPSGDSSEPLNFIIEYWP